METIPEGNNVQGKRDYDIFEGRKGSCWSLLAHNGTLYTVSALQYLWRCGEREGWGRDRDRKRARMPERGMM